MDYHYHWLPGTMVPPELAAELASLYSAHYGIWSRAAARNPGGRIRLSPQRINQLLAVDQARLAYATLEGVVIGYAIAIQARVPDYGFVSWVTQLVVHEDHRQENIGKSLLFAIWQFTDHFAWGLLTANPFAIRALEKATRRRCTPARIFRNHRKLRSFALQFVTYVTQKTELAVTKEGARINTEFPIDHSTLDDMLQSVTRSDVPWKMGSLQEGWEWFAFTFQDQEQIGLSAEEIEIMLRSSDHVTKTAYSRMLLNRDHGWAQFGAQEAHFIASLPGMESRPASVLDVGCGTGRHATELAALGFDVTGIDYLDNLIQRARENALQRQLGGVQFRVADCRQIDLHQQYDLVLCLYDVIGSYADERENTRIADTLARHLRPGGYALISVMNLELTERRAKHVFSVSKNPDRLLSLRPSGTMEKTGDIFDPDHYMLDTETSIVYRKEQFTEGNALPAELVVRDRRYRQADIESLCRSVGLDVIWSRFVRAGRWEESLDRDSDRAKEILVFCRKP
jgi:2-polyprenyl-3-methyl-5-hydroxy-6-metoxy-1,4-benzoquinol methylase/GNAT superfamily N-acetyltransferase